MSDDENLKDEELDKVSGGTSYPTPRKELNPQPLPPLQDKER